MRTMAGIAAGLLTAALLLAGACYGYVLLYRLPASPDFYSVFNLSRYALDAPREALACLIGGSALAGLAGGWVAAAVSRIHRAMAAFSIGAAVMAAAIGLAAFIPFPAWLTVSCLLLPMPLAVVGIRLAIPRLEV